MIPITNHAKVISSGDMETQNASIEMTAEMFDMLSSKVYQNKELAVVREIICNAKDAHVDADIEQAITVHVPNTLESWFSVRDYGKGLSHEDVMKLYLSYGKSTKTTSNDVIGGLGIGSKSPLAYASSFTVMSYYGGIVSTYNIYKDKGIPCVSLLHKEKTDQPTGLMVKVNVKREDYDTFKRETTRFLRFFDYPVTVIGAELDCKVDVRLDSELYTAYTPIDWSYNGHIRAIMGGVVYSIDNKHVKSLSKFFGKDFVLLKFNIGELSVAASRESLSEDKETIAAIQAKVDKVLEQFKEDIQEKINGLTLSEIYDLLHSYNLTTYDRDPKTRAYTYFFGKGFEDLTIPNSSPAELFDLTFSNLIGFGTGYYRKSNTGTKYYFHQIDPKQNLFLVKDAKKSFNTVAKQLRKEHNKRVLLVEEHDKSTVEKYFGKVNFLSTKELAEKALAIAKANRKVYVAKSGIFNQHWNEITELEEESEGYYIPYTRDTPHLTGNTYHLSKDRIEEMVVALALRMPKTKFYFVRVGGMRAINKTNIEELTLDGMMDLLMKEVKKDEAQVLDILKYHKADLNVRFPTDRVYQRNKKKILAAYPNFSKHMEKKGVHNELSSLLYFLPEELLKKKFPKLNDEVTKYCEAVFSEYKAFDRHFGFMRHFRSYGINAVDEQNIDDYIEYLIKNGVN